jgi:Response regulators consisting of a CheY-like receiver domain and a winged-helix DNA-binding domain
MSRILIIEDNATLAQGLANNLELEGHTVHIAPDAAQGLGEAASYSPDLIVLDLMLPDQSGYRVLRELRDGGNQAPVLILTALGDESDKVRGLRVGADDYVTKPFGLLELLARIDALLRRAGRGTGTHGVAESVRFGAVTVYPATHSVIRGDEIVPLRPKEYQLLLALISRAGRVVSRTELLTEVWGYQDEVMSRTVDTHIAELRRKLEDDPASPRHFLTVRKAGYRFTLEPAVSGQVKES